MQQRALRRVVLRDERVRSSSIHARVSCLTSLVSRGIALALRQIEAETPRSSCERLARRRSGGQDLVPPLRARPPQGAALCWKLPIAVSGAARRRVDEWSSISSMVSARRRRPSASTSFTRLPGAAHGIVGGAHVFFEIGRRQPANQRAHGLRIVRENALPSPRPGIPAACAGHRVRPRRVNSGSTPANTACSRSSRAQKP